MFNINLIKGIPVAFYSITAHLPLQYKQLLYYICHYLPLKTNAIPIKEEMKTNASLYNEFYGIDPKNYEQIYTFYSDNEAELEGRITFDNWEDFNTYMLIMAQYIVSLENLEKHHNATVYAERVLPTIVAQTAQYQIDIKTVTPYRSILACKGRCHYTLNEFGKSIATFKQLVTMDADNSTFRNWLISAKSKQRRSLNKYFFVAAAALLAIGFMFSDQLNPPAIKLYLLIAGFSLLWLATINAFFVDMIKRMIRK